MASGIGALTNPNKLANTFRSEKKSGISYDTIKDYIDYLCDSFIVEKSTRYDIKGKRYVSSPYKYYFMDLGLRNARINFRQYEKSHLMENLIYNEMRVRGFNVDVGTVPTYTKNEEGKSQRANLKVDFVCNLGSRRYYIQSAYRMESEEKIRQERASLLKVDDSFKKIIVLGEECPEPSSVSSTSTTWCRCSQRTVRRMCLCSWTTCQKWPRSRLQSSVRQTYRSMPTHRC